MQEVYNAGWYAGNEVINYPFEGSCIDNEDNSLPTTLITDIRIITTTEKVFYLAGITCSEYLLSVVISSEDGMELVLTLPQKVKPLTHYQLQSFSENTSGVIAFGHAIEYGQWRFSTEEQARLHPSCVIRMNPFPVTSFAGLQGDVLLTAGNNLKIEKKKVRIGFTRADGEATNFYNLRERDAFVISIDETGSGEDSINNQFLAKSAHRPDNNDCDYIESFGGCKPDCDGNIQLDFSTELENCDSITANAVQSGSINTCSGVGYEHVGIQLEVTENEESYKRQPKQFGQCGMDQCDPDYDKIHEFQNLQKANKGKGLDFSDINAVYPLNDGEMVNSCQGVSSNGELALGTSLIGTNILLVFGLQELNEHDVAKARISWGDGENQHCEMTFTPSEELSLSCHVTTPTESSDYTIENGIMYIASSKYAIAITFLENNSMETTFYAMGLPLAQVNEDNIILEDPEFKLNIDKVIVETWSITE